MALDALPEMRVILVAAQRVVARMLERAEESLHVGWWLNVMRPEEITYAHTHDAADELLSGVYYVDVPSNSGRLIMQRDKRREEVEPRAGTFVFLAPDVLHEVTRNDSGRVRVSVGLNFGPADAPA
ncbi:MAG TPA: putative 2OG-Fe(II) oxygenase [Candidatus Methylomirabilis sp.]|nr:putative 2OG-Fe(II) oxygenase [Candidatus Methylomirabilis sp.]